MTQSGADKIWPTMLKIWPAAAMLKYLIFYVHFKEFRKKIRVKTDLQLIKYLMNLKLGSNASSPIIN